MFKILYFLIYIILLNITTIYPQILLAAEIKFYEGFVGLENTGNEINSLYDFERAGIDWVRIYDGSSNYYFSPPGGVDSVACAPGANGNAFCFQVEVKCTADANPTTLVPTGATGNQVGFLSDWQQKSGIITDGFDIFLQQELQVCEFVGVVGENTSIFPVIDGNTVSVKDGNASLPGNINLVDVSTGADLFTKYSNGDSNGTLPGDGGGSLNWVALSIKGSNDPWDEDDANAILNFINSPSIETVKTAEISNDTEPTGLSAGDTVTYTIVNTNTGDATLTNVTIQSDTLTRLDGSDITSLTAGSFNLADGGTTLDPGESNTYTATYTVAQDDIAAGGLSNTATGVGQPLVGDPVTDEGVVVLEAGPALETVKTAEISTDPRQDGLSAGDTVTYTIVNTNTGNVTLTNVTIQSDTLTRLDGSDITSLTAGSFNLAGGGTTLDPGESNTYTATYTVEQADIDAGGLSNTATGVGTTPSGDLVTDVSDDGIDNDGDTSDDPTVLVASSSPSIETVKTVVITDDRVPAGLSAGDTVTYTIVNTNTGNVTLTNVTIQSDTLTRLDGSDITSLTAGSFDIAGGGATTLAPGASNTYTATYTVEQADIDAGGLRNTATGVGTTPSGDRVTDVSDDGIDNDGDTLSDPTDLATGASTPALETVKTVVITDDPGQDGLSAGDTVTYTIVNTNTGNVTLTNVTIQSDTLTRLNGSDITSLTAGSFDIAGGDATTLAPGASNTYTATYTVEQADIDAGGLRNTATGVGTTPSGDRVTDLSDDGIDNDENTSDDPTDLVASSSPSIETVKTAEISNDTEPTGLSAGDTVTYTIVNTNTGNVTLTDVKIASDTLTRLNGSDITSLTAGSFDIAGGDATTLAPGASNTYTATYTVEQADIDAGGLRNTATGVGTTPSDDRVTDVSDDGIDNDGDTLSDPTDLATGASTPALETVKTVVITDDPGQDGLSAGDTVTYTIVNTNTGNVTLTNVTIQSDTLTRLDGSDITSLTAGSFDIAGGDATTLAPGASNTYTATYTVEQADIDAGGLRNTATGVGTTPSGDRVTDLSDDGIDNDENTSDDPTDLVASSSPSIETVKTVVITDDRVPAGLSAGDTVTYTIVNTNTGNVTLTNVTIQSDTLTRLDGSDITSLTAGSFNIAGGDATTLAPGASNTYTATYTVEQADIDAGGLRNTATGVGTTPSDDRVTDVSDDGIDNDENTSDDPTDLATGAPVGPVSITVKKRASVSVSRRGDVISFTITLTNSSSFPADALNVIDMLPTGFFFQPDSAQVDGVPITPTVNGQSLTFVDIMVPASKVVELTLSTRIGANASSGEHTNRALAIDSETGDALSVIAKAIVRVEEEHIFDCGEIIGKVFDDVNSNGYQNKGERGLPGVRLATVKGLLITTDKHGRFNVPCAAIPDSDIGSNFILKLDVRTLPTGYLLTTENPRVVRLTRGKLTKLNFGVTIGRVVRIDLNSSAFVNQTATATRELVNGINRLVNTLSQEPSVLKISYARRSESRKLARARIGAIKKLFDAKWKKKKPLSRLNVEIRIVDGG